MANVREFRYHAERDLMDFEATDTGFKATVPVEIEVTQYDRVVVEGKGYGIRDVSGPVMQIVHDLRQPQGEEPWCTEIWVWCNRHGDIKRHADQYKGIVHG